MINVEKTYKIRELLKLFVPDEQSFVGPDIQQFLKQRFVDMRVGENVIKCHCTSVANGVASCKSHV